MSNAKFTVKVDQKKLRALIGSNPERLEQFLDMEAETMVNNIKLSFGTSPSSPGDPPGVDTGALRNSMRWESGGKMTRRIMDGVEYGIYLEFGTEKMIARPFMGPEFRAAEARLDDDMRNFRIVP